jgi:hypothetical protein
MEDWPGGHFMAAAFTGVKIHDSRGDANFIVIQEIQDVPLYPAERTHRLCHHQSSFVRTVINTPKITAKPPINCCKLGKVSKRSKAHNMAATGERASTMA